MKLILTSAFSLLLLFVNSQIKSDVVIKNDAYTSYVNTKIMMPVYVQYKLYKGGGRCERSNKWINDSGHTLIADSSYAGSGYEKGHLANAEDFAYNCRLDSLTFNNYNRLPQTKALNRGIWKAHEKEIRDISQTDSLLIICGGYWDPMSSKIVKGMSIPSRCWKVVYSLSKKEVISSYIFTNSDNPIKYECKVSELELILGYSINLPSSKPKKKPKSK